MCCSHVGVLALHWTFFSSHTRPRDLYPCGKATTDIKKDTAGILSRPSAFMCGPVCVTSTLGRWCGKPVGARGGGRKLLHW